MSYLEPKCSEKADMLVVTLGSAHSVQLGTKLSLAAGNNIRELKSEEDYGEEAAGTVTISRSKSSDSKPDFKLSAPAEICPGSSFDVELSNLKGFGRGRQQINWAIDSVPSGAVDVAELKKKVVVSKNKKKMTVESSWVKTFPENISNPHRCIFVAGGRNHLRGNSYLRQLLGSFLQEQDGQVQEVPGRRGHLRPHPGSDLHQIPPNSQTDSQNSNLRRELNRVDALNIFREFSMIYLKIKIFTISLSISGQLTDPWRICPRRIPRS